jgi:hypothetical protein
VLLSLLSSIACGSCRACGQPRMLCMVACGCRCHSHLYNVPSTLLAVLGGAAAPRVTKHSWTPLRQRACTAMSASVAAPDPPVQTEKVHSAACRRLVSVTPLMRARMCRRVSASTACSETVHRHRSTWRRLERTQHPNTAATTSLCPTKWSRLELLHSRLWDQQGLSQGSAVSMPILVLHAHTFLSPWCRWRQ